MAQLNSRMVSGVGADPSRRRFVQWTGVGLASLLGHSPALGADEPGKRTKTLQRGDEVKISVQAETLIQKAYDLGYKYEKRHGG